MRAEKLYNVLEGFDFRLLNDPEFKEDSVREEIIVPIIKGLGYSSQKPNKIVRSRNLLHPFVSIGSKRKNIYMVPDYLFEVNDKPAWILDAKSPTEKLANSKHVEQAYSYAIHSEVRVRFFALCNGFEFVLYDVSENEPVLQIPTYSLPVYWDSLKKILAPTNVFDLNNLDYKKDFGLHLKRLGFNKFESLVFPNVPITHIGQMDPDFFSLSGSIKENDETYVVSFDFDENCFNQLKDKIPQQAIDLLSKRNNTARQAVKFGDMVYFVNIDCRIGETLEENDKEIFLPMWVNQFISDEEINKMKME
ncbi:MAG: type I restriction enzyme HsdR N-terminal domain-containing protein [Prolixibacteraceae bacterium]|nr:type I restriction enzyme HsdR N-terminal domain-containing protein [Prolixibacteraceae bacterium]MBN2648203.1 type I restriction enzyme HsdR N-terminal domain-containing protein [Prolixibacteraceae bacterium]